VQVGERAPDVARVLLYRPELFGKPVNKYSEVFFEVTLNGATQTLKAGTGTFVLGTGLGVGPHSLRIARRNEALFGVSVLNGLSISEQDYLPASLPARRLEIIGDSISAGYGNEGCPFKNKENSELTYGAINRPRRECGCAHHRPVGCWNVQEPRRSENATRALREHVGRQWRTQVGLWPVRPARGRYQSGDERQERGRLMAP